MKFVTKKILLVLAAFFLVFAAEAQTLSDRLIFSIAARDREIDTIIDTVLVNLQVSVRSSKKGVLENLTSGNFKVYDAGKLQKVEYFSFDESTNKYNIAYVPEISETDKKRRTIELKIKLSAEEKKELGKITVDKKKWILSKPEKKWILSELEQK